MKLPSIAEIMQGTNEIFNPYCKKSYEKPSNSHAKHDYIISERRLNSVGAIQAPSSNSSGESVNNLDDESKSKKINHNIYVFKIRATTAAVQVMFEDSHGTEQQVQEANFRDDTEKEQTGSWLAFTYFDKGIEEMLLEDSTDTSDNKNESNGANYQYFCHYLGQITNNDYDNLSRWQEVPREFFSSVNDYVYLLIVCKDITPYLQIYNFPFEKPFFWDLPVATSIYSGHTLSDSKILLGNVMILVSRRRNIEEAPNGLLQLAEHTTDHIVSEGIVAVPRSINYIYCTLKGHYKWAKDSAICTCENDDICSVKHPEIRYVYGEKEYICSNVELDLYVYEENRNGKGNDITAFVWRSGSEDDLVKKSYLSDTHSEEPAKLYNQYSYILDSFSLGAIYGSFASLTKIGRKNAARYTVRHIARQPEGCRSISIEGHLAYLMGGVLYHIENIMPEDRDDDALAQDKFNRVQDLFDANGNHLLYDSNVSYGKLSGDDLYYLKFILGIEENSNGCRALESLLKDIFSYVSELGMSVNYVYCDIENIHNDARMLAVHRFSDRYQKILEGRNDDKRQYKIYDTLYEEINSLNAEYKDIMKSLQSLEYYWGEKKLKYIASVLTGEDKNYLMYGIANSKSHAERRNVNVWDVVMKNYTNRLFHDYIYLPVHDAFPNAVFSADSRFYSKGYLDRAELFETYLGGSLKLLGDMYSSIPLYGDHMTKGYKKLNMDNWKILPEPTLFSFFMDHINRLRVVALSSPQNHFNVFITSWNIWAYEMNKELHFFKNNLPNGNTKDEKAKNNELHMKAQAYHKELLYHTFLLNPDKAIAYFNLEPKRRKDDADDYIAIPETTYFTESYEGLQEILTNMNDVVNGCVIEPIINTMAIETEPFVITGAKIGNCNLWRLTIDTSKGKLTIIRRFNDISILIGSKEILFEGAASTVINETICGCFVKTPMDVYPAVRTRNNNYYYTNPAISIDCSKSVRDKMTFEIIDCNDKGFSNFVRLTFPYNQYTLFGALPRKHSISMRFKVTEQMFAKCILLHISALQVKEKELCFTLNPLDSKEVTSIPFQLLNVPTATEPKFNIELGDLCELKVSITILTIKLDTTDNSGTFEGVVSYSLTDITKKENGKENYLWESGGINWEFSNKHGNQCLVDGISILEYQTRPDFLKDSGTPVLIKDLVNNALEELDIIDNGEREEKRKDILMEIHNKVLDEIPVQVNDFRLYFSDHQEKLELFRESDGRNISNISNIISNTKNDTLIGKFSWLNAENTPVTYRLVLTADNFVIKGKTYDNITDIITYPFDGRIKIERASNQLVEFIVAPNSEGYMLVKFPKLAKDVLHVQWQLSTKSLLTKRWSMIGLVEAGINKKE